MSKQAATHTPVRLDQDGFGVGGMHGGYLIAEIVRVLCAIVGNTEYAPLSIQAHFVASAKPGEADVTVEPERSGRSLLSFSFRLAQRGDVIALGTASFASPRQSTVVFNDHVMPHVPDPAACARASRDDLGLAPWAEAFEMRPCIGDRPFSGATAAVSGGWIRPIDGRPLDEPTIAGLLDSWIPSVRTRMSVPSNFQPTIDLSILFRNRSPRSAAGPADHCLIRVESRLASGGFWEEDGVLWARDGIVLAQSRQLAIVG